MTRETVPTIVSALLRTAAFLFVVVGLFQGCSLRVEKKEALFKYDAETDALEILVIYEGISSTDPKPPAIAEISDAIEMGLKGRRRFHLAVWGGYDLDKGQDEGEKEKEPEEPAQTQEEQARELLEQETEAWSEGTRILRSGLYLDEKKRLCGFQVVRIENLSQGIEIANRALSAMMAKWEKEDDYLEETRLLDDRSRERMHEFANGDGPWLSFLDGEFELRVPVTRDSFVRVQSALAEKVAESSDQDLGGRRIVQHLLHVRHFSVEDEQVVVRFGPSANGIFLFTDWAGDDHEYDDGVKLELERRGLSPAEAEWSSDGLKKAFGWETMGEGTDGG